MRWQACLWVWALLAIGCGEDERPPQIDPHVGAGGRQQTVRPPRDRGTDDAGAGDAAVEPGDPSGRGRTDAAAGPAGEEPRPEADGGALSPTNCGDLTCRGHGACEVVDGRAICVCDEGYVTEGEGADFECVVDTSCKRLRPLEQHCRVVIGGPPAVATFFAVDYCAGTAVLPEDLGDLDEAFEIFENGANILENEESVAQVIERDVESYITIALDVSKSVTGVAGDTRKQEALSALIRELRAFVAGLEAPRNQPPVTISVLVFGRFVEEYVPFTNDLGAVDEALARIESDPDAVVKLVGGDGTALYQAVSTGIDSVERIQSLRHLVTHAGVLTTGTLVVITDGRDSSNAKLDESRIEDTRVNLISIGISNDIDDSDLQSIGRDGSFLTPAQEDWAHAFSEIAQRVEEYPERAYLLAYCSSATTGNVTVSVGLRGESVEVTAGCDVDAEVFSSDPADVCDLELFRTACEQAECGTLFACGACADRQCCSGNTCQRPAATPQCLDQNALCAPEGLVCAEVQTDPRPEEELDQFLCREPFELGEDCSDEDYCAPGHSFCEEVAEDDFQCVPVTLQTGDRCGDADDHRGARCPEGNCAQKTTTNPTDPYRCMREARVFERCSGSSADARCELGARCKGSTCASRNLWTCSTNEDCLSGYCDDHTKLCTHLGECPFSWDSKVVLAE